VPFTFTATGQTLTDKRVRAAGCTAETIKPAVCAAAVDNDMNEDGIVIICTFGLGCSY